MGAGAPRGLRVAVPSLAKQPAGPGQCGSPGGGVLGSPGKGAGVRPAEQTPARGCAAVWVQAGSGGVSSKPNSISLWLDKNPLCCKGRSWEEIKHESVLFRRLKSLEARRCVLLFFW